MNSAKSYILITYSLLTYYIHISYIHTDSFKFAVAHAATTLLSYYSLTYSSINTTVKPHQWIWKLLPTVVVVVYLALCGERYFECVQPLRPTDSSLKSDGWMKCFSKVLAQGGQEIVRWRQLEGFLSFNCSIIQVRKWQFSRQGRVWREGDVFVTF